MSNIGSHLALLDRSEHVAWDDLCPLSDSTSGLLLSQKDDPLPDALMGYSAHMNIVWSLVMLKCGILIISCHHLVRWMKFLDVEY